MRKQREIILLLTSIFIVVVAWIGFSIYHNAYTSTINDTLSQEIIDIAPNFNTAALEKLKTRQYVDPIYTFPSKGNKADNTNASSSAKITPTSTQNSTGSGSINLP